MQKTLLLLFTLELHFLSASISLGQTTVKENTILDSIKTELLKIHDTDQNSRLKLDSLFKANPNEESSLKQSLRDSIRYYDSVNVIKVTELISKYGWLSEREVGAKANLTIFSVVQHAPFKTQKQLLPIVEKALKEGKLKPSHYALFKDRVLLRQGYKQLYGSQISYDHQTGRHFVAPLEDPDHVDERRKSVGLGSLADYAKQWRIAWNAADYKKQEYPNLFVEIE